ncbi:MAG TPA: type II secretion system inner membrane protein GspF [Gammaproteobacteria bacterium]|nr:type II secretion system inner membrane protein GspF [Gammaproteobacteria bacterium]
MGAFEYTVLDTRGREKKGIIEGDTARAVRQKLREQGLIPLAIETAAARESRRARTGFSLRRRISSSDLALITRQLATLVASGLPVEEALRASAEQNDKPRLKSMIMAVRGKVMEGHSLAHGLADFPHVFPEIFRATVTAGEQTGHLDAVLERLADYAESRQDLRQKLALALIYPILLTVVATAIVIGLMTYVVPQVVQVFVTINAQLPLVTRILITLSEGLRSWGWLILILLVLAAITIRQMLKRPGPRHRFHQWQLHAPLIGRLVRGINTARFTRTLSILAGSGVPLLEALRISGDVVSNLPMRDAVMEAAERVREGAAIHKALAQRKLFPPMTIHLIASGEQSGALDDMLERAAINQERELSGLIAGMLAILEPGMILLMGAAVLFIVLAILLPIFDLNQLVH